MNEDQTQPVNKMRTSDTGINTLEWRLANIEKHNQIRKISSGDDKTYFDTETGEIRVEDGDNAISIIAGKIELYYQGVLRCSLNQAGVTFLDSNGDLIGTIYAIADNLVSTGSFASLSDLIAGQNVQGKHKSGDGTAGVTGTLGATATATVKDGIITGIT